MAFMALFGWILIPILLLGFVLSLIASPVVWAAEHPGLVNTIAAGLLVFNLLVLLVLLRRRGRRKKAGKTVGRAWFLAFLWEVWVVLCCAAYLTVQPLRFLPDHLGELFSTEKTWYGDWVVTGVQAKTPGCAQTQEETDAFLGTTVVYEEEQFSTDGQYWGLIYMEYKRVMAWKGDFPKRYGMELEDLGVGDRLGLWSVTLNPSKKTAEASPLGLSLYILDRDTLLLYRKGVFFLAERAESDEKTLT